MILAALLFYASGVARRRLRENQELRRVLAQIRVDRIIGDGYNYDPNDASITFIHQIPGRTDNLLISIADIKTVMIDGVAHSKLWMSYQEIRGRAQELEDTHPFEIIDRIYDDIGAEYYRRDAIARVGQSSELRAIEVFAPRLRLEAFGEVKHWVLLTSSLPNQRECIMVLKHGTPLKFQIRGRVPEE
jgi:hypothetical protein